MTDYAEPTLFDDLRDGLVGEHGPEALDLPTVGQVLADNLRTLGDALIGEPGGTVTGIRNDGQVAKAAGMALALSPETLDAWKAGVRDLVTRWAREGRRFTSEDVTDAVGMPVAERGMNRNNAVGAMINGLARRGVIRKTSERRASRKPTSHGAELVVWTGAP